MKKNLICVALAALLLFSAAGCGGTAAPPRSEDTLHILATTYPVYLFARAVTDKMEGVEITRLNTGEASCLHDYTLSVTDMKAIEGADVILMNGAGLEDFMADALERTKATVIDCSVGIELLPAMGHEGHDHATEYDPHFWLDPLRAIQMTETIMAGLCQVSPEREAELRSNTLTATALLQAWDSNLHDLLQLEDIAPDCRELITFHDGFQYFAQAYDFTILRSIEEEEGAEASAAEIREIVALIDEHDIPVIFTEVNGSDSTAKAIARETGVSVGRLTTLMSGEGSELGAYLEGQLTNAAAIINGFAGKEVLTT